MGTPITGGNAEITPAGVQTDSLTSVVHIDSKPHNEPPKPCNPIYEHVDSSLLVSSNGKGQILYRGRDISYELVDRPRRGIGTGRAYDFRRGVASEFDVMAGKNYSSILLHHRDALTLNDRHYSMGTATLDLLGLRLGEVNESELEGDDDENDEEYAYKNE